MEQIAIAIGLVGAVVVLAAYFMLSAGTMRADSYAYPLMNMCGSICVLISLGWQWNLASAIINGTWVLISLVGMWRIYKARSAKAQA